MDRYGIHLHEKAIFTNVDPVNTPLETNTLNPQFLKEMKPSENRQIIIISMGVLPISRKIANWTPIINNPLRSTIYFNFTYYCSNEDRRMNGPQLGSNLDQITTPISTHVKQMTADEWILTSLPLRNLLWRKTTFTLLKFRVEATHPKDRNCCFVFDKMWLKQHFDYYRQQRCGLWHQGWQVTVFVVRGIATKWKQPIAYSFENSHVPATDVYFILQEALIKVQSTGLNVRAIVWDQEGPANIAALKLLGFSCDKPYTPYKQHPSHEKKIHIIFDTPHLVKIVCNNPIRHDIIIGEKTVSWKYLEAVYSLDKVYSIRWCKINWFGSRSIACNWQHNFSAIKLLHRCQCVQLRNCYQQKLATQLNL